MLNLSATGKLCVGNCFNMERENLKKARFINEAKLVMTVILGLNINHFDTSACLIVDGKIIAAIAEERLGARVKNTSVFPKNAIKFVLKYSGILPHEVKHIAIARDPAANMRAKIAYAVQHPLPSLSAYLTAKNRDNDTQETIITFLKSLNETKFSIDAVFHSVEHHIAHIASSYYTSPFEHSTLGFSYDASGDFVSGMITNFDGNALDVKKKFYLPSSLGFFYTGLCQFIGFDRFGEEYKVMGLASYGEDQYSEQMNNLLFSSERGYKLNQKYFKMHSGGISGALDESKRPKIDLLFTDKIKDLLGDRGHRNAIGVREKNIAKSMQVRFEDVVIQQLKLWKQRLQVNDIVTAGGGALNGVANAKIASLDGDIRHFIHPAAGDDGTSIGAALWVLYNVLGASERFELRQPYLGGSYDEKSLRDMAQKDHYKFEVFTSENEKTTTVAQLLADFKIIGWFQGRSEWGPRALGNRSILANPTGEDTKQKINNKIKRREGFRPFAPSVLQEDVTHYFEEDINSPFMMHVVKFKRKFHDKFPAVVHVDGTGRLQTVSRDSNSLFYNLISEFKKLTGVGMLLNTSFNENEPVVESPIEAYDCFKRNDFDILVVNNLIIYKDS